MILTSSHELRALSGALRQVRDFIVVGEMHGSKQNAPLMQELLSIILTESERLIQDALLRLMKGKTVIAIAHRLSTVMNMDRLIVMEQGTAMLSGKHDELLAHESNLHKKLWEIQSGGFIRAD